MKNITIIPKEYEECTTFVEWLDWQITLGTVILYTHIPSETFTKSWAIKIKNKRMGVRKGFPDYFIITRKRAIAIEMKRIKGGAVSLEQDAWLEALERVDIPAKVCKGMAEAAAFVLQHV